MRTLTTLMLLLACAFAQAQELGEEKTETELALERSQYGGWPVVLIFNEPGLVASDPNAPLWTQPAIQAACKRWLKVTVNTPADQPPAKGLIARFEVTKMPTILLVDWRGAVLERYVERADGDALLKALGEHSRGVKPLPDREISYRRALLKRARARVDQRKYSSALKDLKSLLRRKPAYQCAVLATALREELVAQAKAEVAALKADEDKAWEKGIKELQRTWRGVDLRAAIAAAKLARAKASQPAKPGEEPTPEKTPEASPKADPRWTRARAKELDGDWLEARTLLRGLARTEGPWAERARARLKVYETDAKIRAAIERLERDKRCQSLKRMAENYLKNGMKKLARAKLEALAKEEHELAAWARRKLAELGP